MLSTCTSAMSQAVQLKNFPGYGPPDGRCLPCSGVSGKAVAVSSCPSRGNLRILSKSKISSMKCVSGGASFVCKASSGHQRRNPDFSRYNKNGFRGRNRRNEERDSFDDEPELLSSKNGPLLSLSNSPKYQATATPGPREKEIVDLFRKVQAQLRERASTKEDKKVEASQGQRKESETVDSLLKLLRKHSMEQSRRKGSSTSKDFISDNSEFYDSYDEDRNTNFFDSNHKAKPEAREPNASSVARPTSNFRRKSPVTQFKHQPTYSTKDNVNSVSYFNSSGNKKKTSVEVNTKQKFKPQLEAEQEAVVEPEMEVEPEPVLGLENELESSVAEGDVYYEVPDGESDIMEGAVYDEVLQVESSEIDDADNDEDRDKQEQNEIGDLSALKLPELRAIAKSRGVKGFSKMKKGELIELLSSTAV